MRVILELVKIFNGLIKFSVDFLGLVSYRQDDRIIIYKLSDLTFLMGMI